MNERCFEPTLQQNVGSQLWLPTFGNACFCYLYHSFCPFWCWLDFSDCLVAVTFHHTICTFSVMARFSVASIGRVGIEGECLCG